jgi:hypothetical protein
MTADLIFGDIKYIKKILLEKHSKQAKVNLVVRMLRSCPAQGGCPDGTLLGISRSILWKPRVTIRDRAQQHPETQGDDCTRTGRNLDDDVPLVC